LAIRAVRLGNAKIEFQAMQHVRATLKKIFADNVCTQAGDAAPLLAWPVACGGAVAANTQALSFVDGVLVVAVPDAVWRNQLQFMSQQYLAGLNQIAGRKTRSISFVVAPHVIRPTA
jgi:predicted nucleic acid-binding Zn ribbon protein